MTRSLNERAFERLLQRLDVDRAGAANRYEDLRRTLIRFFEWRDAPSPEEHADETIDRLARRLDEGVEIANIGAYSYTVARLVLLETRKGPLQRQTPLDAHDLVAPEPADEAAEKERRLACLDRCLRNLPGDGRELIVAYYREQGRDRIALRRALAERLGIRLEALANRAQRLRDKLEHCVSGCVRTRSAT